MQVRLDGTGANWRFEDGLFRGWVKHRGAWVIGPRCAHCGASVDGKQDGTGEPNGGVPRKHLCRPDGDLARMMQEVQAGVGIDADQTFLVRCRAKGHEYRSAKPPRIEGACPKCQETADAGDRGRS